MKPTYLRYRYLWPMLAIIFLLISCEKQELTQVKEVVRPAKILTVADGASLSKRQFPGSVEFSDKAIQSFRVGGILVKLPAKAGMKVKKGQLLAQLDPKDFKLRVDDRQAKYDLALVQFNRAKELVEKKLIPIADFDKAKSNMIAAKSDLQLAKADLSYTKITSPFNGVVSKVLVDNHENVAANSAVLHIQSEGTIDITFYIPESILARVRTGEGRNAGVSVFFDSHPETKLKAQFVEADTEPDPKTQTYKIKVQMQRPKKFLVAEGMSVTVTVDMSKILIDTSDKIIVPVEAVFIPEEKALESKEQFVWLVNTDDMRVKLTAVTVGQITNTGIEITSGIKPGDQIVAAGVHFITDNQRIKPWVKERGL